MLSTYFMPGLSISFLITTLNVSSKVEIIIYSFLCPPCLSHNVCRQELLTSSNVRYIVLRIDLGSPGFPLCELGKAYSEGISSLPWEGELHREI